MTTAEEDYGDPSHFYDDAADPPGWWCGDCVTPCTAHDPCACHQIPEGVR